MVDITFHDLTPFGKEVPGRKSHIIVVKSPGRGFSPNQITEPVRMIEESFLKYLLVQAGPVESCRHRKLYVILKRFITRCGPVSLRVEPLIQDKPEVKHLSIEENPVAFHHDRSKSHVG